MRSYLTVKEILDFIFAMILMIFLLPIMIAVAIAVKVEDRKGPIFFKQKRIGKDLKEFDLFKFRSMRTTTVKNGKSLSDAERITMVGKFIRKTSIDELPQLFNILKQEMSFIGPRPLPPLYLPYYTDEEIHRHDIKPGISGWAQVNGRNSLNWDSRFKYDLIYLHNISFLFDLKILFLTIKKILLKSDIHIRGTDSEDKSLHKIRSLNKKNQEVQ